jgi:PilZ domain
MAQQSRNPRTRMAEVVYLNMQSGNGGIVVDVSRTGLGFQAACPIQPDEPMSFRFSSESIHDIEVTGDLVWTDQDRKRGGLRFGMLPVEVRQQIQRWLDEAESGVGSKSDRNQYAGPKAEPPPSLHEPVLPRRSPEDTSSSTSWKREPVPQRLGGSSIHTSPQVSIQEPPTASRRNAPSEPRRREDVQPDFSPAFPRRQRILSEWNDVPRSRSTAATVALTAIFAILATVAVLSILYKKEAGETFIRFGEIILGQRHGRTVDATGGAPNPTTDSGHPSVPLSTAPKSSEDPTSAGDASRSPATSPSDSASGPVASQTIQAAPSPKAPNSQSPGTNSSAESRPTQGVATDSEAVAQTSKARPSAGLAATAPAKSSNNTAQTSEGQGDGKAELALARDYLSRGSPRSRDVAMQLLWVAVGDGNTEAEVELADLYLGGEGGASRNCTQARILLRAAANGGNAVAGQRLEELSNYGCR